MQLFIVNIVEKIEGLRANLGKLLKFEGFSLRE